MSLFVKVACGFFTHRKTVRLRAALGDDALWIMPRLWAYAAENQPDGSFADFSAAELATVIGYTKDANRMLEALLQARFLDPDPLRIHDWSTHNAYHRTFAERAKRAAEARWSKERSKEKGSEKRGEEQAYPKHASSISEQSNAPSPPPKLFPREIDSGIKDLKTELVKIAYEDKGAWGPILLKLQQLEIAKFGVARTHPPKPKPKTKAGPDGSFPTEAEWKAGVASMRAEIEQQRGNHRRPGASDAGTHETKTDYAAAAARRAHKNL